MIPWEDPFKDIGKLPRPSMDFGPEPYVNDELDLEDGWPDAADSDGADAGGDGGGE